MRATMRYVTFALVLATAAATGCNTGSRSEKQDASGTTGGGTTPGGGGNNGALAVTGASPNTGSTAGGTSVTLNGTGFASGLAVHFFDPTTELPGASTLATNVVIVSATQLTCLTPAHAAGVVDVRVDRGGGQFATLNNAFQFDPTSGSGALARVADFGDPKPWEIELLELHNRARRDPAAEGTRLGITLSPTNGYVAKPPLAYNGFLAQAAGTHTQDMIGRNFYSHWNPDGVGPTGRILATPFDLHGVYPNDPIDNKTESIGVGSNNLFNTPQKVHDAFVIDAGQNPPKHRDNILGRGTPMADAREVGMGVVFGEPANATPALYTNPAFSPEHWVTQEFARTKRDRAIVQGVVYNDDGDGICEANAPYRGNSGGEGVPGVTVTLSHASGFTISTQTSSAGYFAFETFVDTAFTITINGQSTTVNIAGSNVKVDLVNGVLRTY